MWFLYPRHVVDAYVIAVTLSLVVWDSSFLLSEVDAWVSLDISINFEVALFCHLHSVLQCIQQLFSPSIASVWLTTLWTEFLILWFHLLMWFCLFLLLRVYCIRLDVRHSYVFAKLLINSHQTQPFIAKTYSQLHVLTHSRPSSFCRQLYIQKNT